MPDETRLETARDRGAKEFAVNAPAAPLGATGLVRPKKINQPNATMSNLSKTSEVPSLNSAPATEPSQPDTATGGHEAGDPTAARARTGKIARMPLSIRDELNRRLEDGQIGNSLVDWLNSLPAAQAVLQAQFDGRPVTRQNLSEWRQGGFRAWQRAQERHALVREWTEQDQNLAAASQGQDFGLAFSRVLLAELALALQQVLEETTDAGTRLKGIFEISGRLAQLRREETHAERVRIEREKWEVEDAARKKREAERLPMSPEAVHLEMIRYLDYYGRGGVTGQTAGRVGGKPGKPASPGAHPANSRADAAPANPVRPGQTLSHPPNQPLPRVNP